MNEPDQVDLCIAVVNYLNSAEVRAQLPMLFTAKHSSKAFIDNPSPGDTCVIVFPGDRANEILTRRGRQNFQQTAEVGIGIVEKLNTNTPALTIARELKLRKLHEAVERVMFFFQTDGFKRDEEAGQTTAPGSRSELYEDKTFNAEITNTYLYQCASP